MEATDLGKVIDGAYKDITQRFGEDASHEDTLPGGFKVLYLRRQVSTVTTVVETIADTDTTLSADDYEIRDNSWALERLSTGTNGRATWGTEVKVTYVTADDARRFDVCIDLIKLELAYTGTQAEKIGDYSTSGLDHARAREAILSRLEDTVRAIA